MALLFMDGFDNYATAEIAELGKWQNYTDAAAPPDNITVTPAGRNGTNSLHVTSQSGGPIYLQRVLPAPISSMIFGIAVNFHTFDATKETPIFQWCDIVTPQVTFSVLPNGQVRFRSGANNGAILATSTPSVISATNTFFYLEIEIVFNSAGSFILRADGVNIPLSASTGNTAPSGNNNFNTFRLGSPANTGTSSGTSVYDFDDMYMLSTTGGVNTTFLGDVRVVTVFPNGPGASTQFTPNGAATNWQCVNEVSEDAGTTFVSDATVGQKDLYTHTPIPTNTGQIFGIQLDAVAEKSDAAGRSIANTILSGGTAQDGATQPLTENYAWYLDIMESDPNTATPWTFSSFQAAQIGVKVAA